MFKQRKGETDQQFFERCMGDPPLEERLAKSCELQERRARNRGEFDLAVVWQTRAAWARQGVMAKYVFNGVIVWDF
jgi:hypothetical protein